MWACSQNIEQHFEKAGAILMTVAPGIIFSLTVV